VALLASGGETVHRAEILADVLAGLDRDLELVLHRGLGLVRSRLESADALRGRRVRNVAAPGGEAGVAEGIDDDGRLLVQLANGSLVRYSAGEVHLAET
jgi:biotin-(acetyl-CoA carboxylase) ligase